MPRYLSMSKLKTWFRKMEHSRLALAGFDMLLRSYSYGLDKTPFLKLTVKEFLWGYPSLIMSINTVRSCAAKVNTTP